jgi:hypothetical protein
MFTSFLLPYMSLYHWINATSVDQRLMCSLLHLHWLDSPAWALAFFTSFLHSSLLNAELVQFLSRKILMSWCTLPPSQFRSSSSPFSFWCVLFSSTMSWLSWKFLITYCKANLKGNGNKIPSSLRPFYIGNASDFIMCFNETHFS